MSVSLYKKGDPVIILDDGKFIGKELSINKPYFKGAGVLKVYASWCPHCQSKVQSLNKLAQSLKPHGMAVYVLNGEDNPIFMSTYQVQGFPTFYEITATGAIGQLLQVASVPDIVRSLCGRNKEVCAFIKQMEG